MDFTYFDRTPSNIPVLIKMGQTTVVLISVAPSDCKIIIITIMMMMQRKPTTVLIITIIIIVIIMKINRKHNDSLELQYLGRQSDISTSARCDSDQRNQEQMSLICVPVP